MHLVDQKESSLSILSQQIDLIITFIYEIFTCFILIFIPKFLFGLFLRQ